MKVNSMRFIDYWAGIPICFLLKMLDTLFGFLSTAKTQHAPVRILFVKPSEMGAIVLSYPLIMRMKKEYPAHRIFFLTFAKNRPLVELLNVVEAKDILTIRDDSAVGFLIDTVRVLLVMSRLKMDIAFDLEMFSRFSAILTYLSGASRRIGFYNYCFEGLYRGNLLTHKVQYNPLLHTSKSILSLAQVAGMVRKATPELSQPVADEEIVIPRCVATKQELIQMKQKLSALGIPEDNRILLLNPGDGTIPLREWPLENFISLTKMLLKEERNWVVIVGTEGASKKAKMFLSAVNNQRCLDFTCKTTVRDLISLMYISSMLIADDCGLAHIASLTPIKQVILFGPESPQLFAPLGEGTNVIYSRWPCSPCLSAFNHRNSACTDNRCLEAIKPEEVYGLIKEKM